MQAIAGWLLNHNSFTDKPFKFFFEFIPVLRWNALFPEIAKSSMLAAPEVFPGHFLQKQPADFRRSKFHKLKYKELNI